MLLEVTKNRRMQEEILEHEGEPETQVKERSKELDCTLKELKVSEERYRILLSDSKVPILFTSLNEV
ncbi:MAG: hypothetical protein K1565_20560 [Candidatus Thiodiazotropha sp. (ex. Lucinisca nassula)]|nr:hypothetical protein [Candidatus Thiodiazotropha sp. (ex. Lucinisca nassula)]